MLILNLKKEWFEKIKSGEKTHEYREVKEYWFKRLFLYSKILCRQTTIPLHNECIFVCGYANKDDKEKRLKAKIKNISIINGKNTDLAIDKDVFDIEFELIEEFEKCKEYTELLQQLDQLKASKEQAEQKLKRIRKICLKYKTCRIILKDTILQIIDEVENAR